MIKFQLTKPISSNNKEFDVIELHEPRVLHMPLVSKLKEGYNSAQLDYMKRVQEATPNKGELQQAQADAQDKKDDEDEAQSEEEMLSWVKAVLHGACLDTDKIFSNMQALMASSGIAKMYVSQDDENKQNMAVGHINQLSVKDLVDLTAKYIAVFILPS